MLDEVAREQFWALAHKARNDGRDLADVLDSSELLLTPQRRRHIESRLLHSIVDMMEQTAPQYWVKDAKTPADAYRQVHQQLRKLAETAELKGLT